MSHIDQIQPFPQRWIDFFLVFQRFEYSLKRHPRFLMHKNRGDKAEASWDAFGNALGNDFFKRILDDNLAKEIFRLPPGKELVGENGELVFGDRQMPTTSCQLFGALRIIRNNLFHGGKFEVTDRNEKLIRDAMNVLNEALLCCDEVRTTFLDYYNEKYEGF